LIKPIDIQIAFDAVELAMAIVKVKKGRESIQDTTLTPKECRLIIEALQILREGNK